MGRILEGMPRLGGNIHIPISFDETIRAVLKVKPEPKEKPTPKAKTKRPGRKAITKRATGR